MCLIESEGKSLLTENFLILRNAALPTALHCLQTQWRHSGCLHKLPQELRLPAGQVRRSVQGHVAEATGQVLSIELILRFYSQNTGETRVWKQMSI